MNYVASIWQYLFTQLKAEYDTASLAAGLNQGYALQKNGIYLVDTNGLGILDTDFDQDTFYKRVPVIGYTVDEGQAKSPISTGMGDGANWEWRNIKLTCVPTVNIAVDGTTTPSRISYLLLKDMAWALIGRSFIIPYVDYYSGKIDGLYQQIGYMQICDAIPPKRAAFKDNLIIDRRDFDISFQVKIAVLTRDGL